MSCRPRRASAAPERRSGSGPKKKGVIDFVTEADLESQRAASRILSDRFHYQIVTEEDAPRPPARGRRWLVDPLDGSTNFLHGYPFFSVSIALVDDGEARLGEMGRFLRRVVTVRCDGSAALDLCNVACGRVDGFWQRRAAGSPFSVDADSIVASCSWIHREILSVLEGSES